MAKLTCYMLLISFFQEMSDDKKAFSVQNLLLSFERTFHQLQDKLQDCQTAEKYCCLIKGYF